MKKRNLFMLSTLLFSTFTFYSCKKENSSSFNSTSNIVVSENLNNPQFSIKVTSLSGKPLEGVTIEICEGENTIKVVETDSEGLAKTRLEDKNYTVQLSDIPNGYYYEKEINLQKGTYDYEIKLSSNVIEEKAPSGTLYQIGDLVYDFSVKTSDGETFTLSEALEEYDAVMINFWYRTCYWCNEEFPFMEEAYQDYQDDIGFIALSHIDTNPAIDDFKYDNELSFPMANDTTQYGLFGVTACPTTVIIDRYGLLAFTESGAITSKEAFAEIFDKFIGEDYVPSMGHGENGGSEGEEEIDRTPTYEMPSSSEIEAVVNGEGFSATYRMDENEENKQFAWPWIISEDGESIKASNSKVDYTAANIMFDVTIPEGKTLAFDYLSSSEKDYDILYVIVDGNIIHEISGVEDEFKTCFAYISEETKSYEISLLYMKDEEGFSGDDTVYVNNIRLVDTSLVNIPTYIFRQASRNLIESNHNYENYITPIYNEDDGYYHVNAKNGPILLAEIIYASNWSNELTPFNIASNGGAVINGKDYKDVMYDYASYASNSTVGLTSVTEELKEALVAITNKYGDPNNENEWLEVCAYYNAYGTNGVELSDPIKGLANFSAYEAKIGDQNFATFDRPILPRGLKFKFTVEEAGVYKINSIGTLESICWIFDEEGNMLKESNFYARKYYNSDYLTKEEFNIDLANFEIYYYFEPNVNYYITPAFYDYLYFGTLQFNVEYVGETYELLTLASPGYWTSTLDEEGNMTDKLISPGINYVLDDDGYYHELREDGSVGSIIYCDFTSIPNIASESYSLEELIQHEFFDFTEYNGVDYTAKMRLYASKDKIKEGELKGLVPVDESLKEILEIFMDVYAGFEGVEHQWLKTCFYYEYYGPSKI